MTVKTPLGDYKVPGGPGVDEATLKTIADETGGAFWLAESAEKLHEIYKEIDRLERTEIESVRHIDYAERFAAVCSGCPGVADPGAGPCQHRFQEDSMSGIRFENPDMLQLLWLLPVLLGVAVYRFHKKDQALRRFAEIALLERINQSVSRASQWWKAVLVIAAAF